MTLDESWNLIETTRVPDAREHAARLTRALYARSLDDIFAFSESWGQLHKAAYRWDLWGAAYFIIGGCSDDGFIDFRTGLILRGRGVYEAAMANPDNLAEVPGAGLIQLEAYIGRTAYEEKTGLDDYYDEWCRRFPPPVNPTRPRPVGEYWDFDDKQEMRRRYPRLWARYGKSEQGNT